MSTIIGEGTDTFSFNVPNTHDEEISVPFKTPKYQDNLNILFGNCDSLNLQKRTKLEILAKNDHIVCLNETNYKESDTTLLTSSGLGKIACIKSLDNISFKNGKRCLLYTSDAADE